MPAKFSGRYSVMQSLKSIVLVLSLFLCSGQGVYANGLLDGRVFTGMIGPVENPDLADSLNFESGQFWSDICTRCGFQPGTYDSNMTDEGVVFTGVLESDSRGSFEYNGLVREDGTIEVSIRWERRRWYWTSQREIAFRGTTSPADETLSLITIPQNMDGVDFGANPLCARF